MKLVNRILTGVALVLSGVLIGYLLCAIRVLKTCPELYEIKPASWFAGILICGACMSFALAVCYLLKGILKRRVQKDDNVPAE